MIERTLNLTSPINGKVVAIETAGVYYKIFLKVSKINLNLYAPINGNLVIQQERNGLNLDPFTYKGYLLNSKISFIIDELKMEIYSGLCSPTLKIDEKYYKKNEKICILLDGLVVIYLPYKPQIELNQIVEAKTTIL